jgi:hypothetical protein
MTDWRNQMSDMMFEEIDESEVVGRVPGKRKLPKWEPMLSWDRVQLSDKAMARRGYSDLTEEDVEFLEEHKASVLANQHRMIDKELELMGIRIQNVKEVRNCKEVVIRL